MLLDLAGKVNGGGFRRAGGRFAAHVKPLAAPVLVAHIAAVIAGVWYTVGVVTFFGAAGLLSAFSAAQAAAFTGVLLMPPVRLTTMVKAAG
jgi:hypothetical protein